MPVVPFSHKHPPGNGFPQQMPNPSAPPAMPDAQYSVMAAAQMHAQGRLFPEQDDRVNSTQPTKIVT